MKKSKQFRGKVPVQPADADNRAYRTEPEAPTKIRATAGRRPAVPKLRILKKNVGRGR